MTRRRFHRRVYLAILRAQAMPERGVICACGCDTKITRAEGYEFNHVLALCLGGLDVPENLEAVRIPCHKKETKGQAGMRAKANRLRKGPRQRKGRAIQSRGFQARPGKHQWPKRRMRSGA